MEVQVPGHLLINSDHSVIYRDAAVFVVPFGKHKGKSIDTVAVLDDGLLYLDWLRGDMRFAVASQFKEALAAYLSDPTIARDLATAMEGLR